MADLEYADLDEVTELDLAAYAARVFDQLHGTHIEFSAVQVKGSVVLTAKRRGEVSGRAFVLNVVESPDRDRPPGARDGRHVLETDLEGMA